MTSGNDKKGPPPRRPAPAGAPQRPAGPTTGGSAARPAPRPGAAPTARPAGPPPRPAPRPAPAHEADADEKTSAINLADFGLAEDEATVSVDSAAIKARAAARAPAHDDGEEKTMAFNVADLPPDDEPKRTPQKTLLGHPAPKPGAAVRGGAAPIKRQDTLAIAPPSRSRPAPAPEVDDEKTSAISLDDIEKIDAAPARPAPKPAAKSPPPQEERTMAMSLDDVDKIDMRPTPQRGGAPKKPAQLEQDEKTMAVSLDDIDRIDAAPKRASARIPSKAEIEAMQEERTTAMSLDDVDRIDANLAKRKAEAASQAPAGNLPARARAAQASKALSSLGSSAAGEGFVGSIGYLFQADSLAANGQAVDNSKKAAGLRNLIISGGAIAALMLAIGFIF